MANLPESPTYEAGVYQIEVSDPVIGGPDGISNKPLRALANRTNWLKAKVDALPDQAETIADAKVAAHNAVTDPHPQYETAVEAAAKITAHKAETDPHPQYATDADLAAAMPAGTVVYIASSAAPVGYLKANGAAISRTAYAALFASIGTTFGVGDGASTFNLPDLRGEFLRGFDDGRGADTGRIFGSAQKGSLNVFDCESGGYGVYSLDGTSNSAPNANAGLDSVTAGYSAASYPGLSLSYAGGVANTNAYTMSSWLIQSAMNDVGGGMTRPRNVALLACIKY